MTYKLKYFNERLMNNEPKSTSTTRRNDLIDFFPNRSGRMHHILFILYNVKTKCGSEMLRRFFTDAQIYKNAFINHPRFSNHAPSEVITVMTH